jgi:hypothetical protein
MHFTTPTLIVLATLASLAMAKDGAPTNPCGAPFCKRAEAMARIKASVLAERAAGASATATPAVFVAGAEAK